MTRFTMPQVRANILPAIAAIFIASGPADAVLAEGGEPTVSFTRDIRPILSNKCFQCHGPDEGTREADLRLDRQEEAFADRGGYAAIAPGEPENSELISRIIAEDPYMIMPPADSDVEPLTEKEKSLLQTWIEDGADWEAHWAFIPPTRPDVPDVEADVPLRNPIDHFVARKLNTAGLEFNPEASKETLIRRVTFDLTGLPPTVEEIDAFLNDESPDAYETLVDRLLQSPHYGEHLARYWLDAARYGDTHGLHLDNRRSIWPYRDWLIQSFAKNKPFDQMVIEQIGGDLLPNPTRDQIVATGFNRCNVSTSEGGSIDEEYYVRYAVDRVETTSTVFLGLTTGCAVCHDHKFDPISQKEFYQLFAYFNSTTEKAMDGNAPLPPPFLELPTPEQSEQKQELQQNIAAVRDEIQRQVEDYLAAHPDLATEPQARKEFVWVDDSVPAGAKLHFTGQEWQWSDQVVHSGKQAMRRVAQGQAQHYFLGARTPLTVGKGDVLFASVYLDPANPPKQIMLQFNDGSWNHRAYWGENHITFGEDGTPSRRRMGDLPPVGQWVRLEVPVGQVDLKPGANIGGIAFTQFDGEVSWDRVGIVTATPQDGTYPSLAAWEAEIGKQKKPGNVPQDIFDAVKEGADKRSKEADTRVKGYFYSRFFADTRDEFEPLVKQEDQLEKQLAALDEAIAKTLVSEEMDEPKEAFVLIRGAYDRKGEPVTRDIPAVLPPLPEGAPNNRLGLAQWLVRDDHPLTARVTVNRWWQRLFGTGLVKTAEDFGIQGEAPSHPELLDWLAREFIESGWDVKAMQKLMVMSTTYRQSSLVTQKKLAVDPENRLLSRGPRFRLDAEMIRDQALAVSGLLNTTIGGESVKPYQPDGLWEAVGYTSSNTANFVQDDGGKLYRRSMYTFWKRTSPPPSMATFDAPSRESCTVQRARTNTPLQALALMNDKQFVEASRHFGQRMLREGGQTTEERLRWGFRSVTARQPDEAELKVLRSLAKQYLNDFAADPDAATQFVNDASTQPDWPPENRDTSNDAKIAAWSLIANLLLNLDETVTKG